MYLHNNSKGEENGPSNGFWVQLDGLKEAQAIFYLDGLSRFVLILLYYCFRCLQRGVGLIKPIVIRFGRHLGRARRIVSLLTE